jgi:hypothetical protein
MYSYSKEKFANTKVVSEAVNPRTDNTMVSKRTKGQSKHHAEN